MLGKKACVLVRESVLSELVTVFDGMWACREAEHSRVAAGQGGRGGGTATAGCRARVVGLAVLTAARQGQG